MRSRELLIWSACAWALALIAACTSGTSSESRSCDEIFGGVAGYMRCEAPAAVCGFYRRDAEGSELTCQSICESESTTCINGYEEAEDFSCASMMEIGCAEAASDAICHCSNPNAEFCESPGSPCSPGVGPGGGSYARFCAVATTDVMDPNAATNLVCLNVCNRPGVDYDDGSRDDGDTCEFDVDCGGGLSCGNDEVGGGATCVCGERCTTNFVAGIRTQFTDEPFGVSFDDDDLWRGKFTCKSSDGISCVDGQRDKLLLVQNTDDPTEMRFQITESDAAEDVNDEFEGRICGSEFNWVETTPGPSGEFSDSDYEVGTWTFSSDTQFTKESTGFDRPNGQVIFKCVGTGALGTDPPDPPSCAQYEPVF